MSKIFCVIQARLTSKRFPNKIFQKIGKRLAIEHVLSSCKDSISEKVLLVVPKDQKEIFENQLSSIYNSKKISIHGGSEDNVLDRYQTSLEEEGCQEEDIVVRITSDCFLISPIFIDRSVSYFKEKTFDYINNSTVTRVLSADNPDDYQTDTDTPDGFNVEVFNFRSLIEAHNNATSQYDIEHVTPWIKRNKKCSVFNTGKISLTGKFSVDTPEDLEIVRALHTLIENNRISFEV